MSDLRKLLGLGDDVKLTKGEKQLADLIEQQQARIAELGQREADANRKSLKHEQIDFGNREYIEMQRQAFGELVQREAELSATVERLRELFNNASGDIHRLFELQPKNMEDGSYEVDGQSLTELGIAFEQAPRQSLNAIKREAFINGYLGAITDCGNPDENLEEAEFRASQRYPD